MIFSFTQFFTWVFSNLIGRFFLRMKFEGQENLNDLKGGGVIFIANHLGSFDPFLISAGIRQKYFRSIKCFRYMTHYKFVTMKWYGFLIWLSGAYPVYPGMGDLGKSLRNTMKILKDDQAVLVFPTGKKCINCQPKDVRPGIAYLNKELSPKIVPVYIEGTYKVGLFDFFLRKREVVIKYGKPFEYKNKSDKDLRENAIDIMQKVWDMK